MKQSIARRTMALLFIGVLTATPAQAGQLNKLLELSMVDQLITETYRAPGFTIEQQRLALPGSFWILRIESNLGRDVIDEERVVLRLILDAVFMDSTGAWVYFDGSSINSGHLAPSASDCVAVLDAVESQKSGYRLPVDTQLISSDAIDPESLVRVYRAPASDALVLKCASGLLFSTDISDRWQSLTAEYTEGLVWGGGKRPRVASIVCRGDGPNAVERLAVWDADGASLHLDEVWNGATGRYNWAFFAPNDRYLYCSTGTSRESFLADHYFVLDLESGQRHPLSEAIPFGRYSQTPDRRFVLFTTGTSDRSFSSDAILLALDTAPSLRTVWKYDSPTPIVEGAVSADGEYAVLRADRGRTETELVLIDGNGIATHTGQREPAGVTGLNVVSGNLLVTGAHLATDSSPQLPGDGMHLFIYGVMP